MRPCTRRIVPAEDVIKAISLNDVLGEHAPWCRTAPNAPLIHTKPLDRSSEVWVRATPADNEEMALDPQLTSVVAVAAVGWTMVASGKTKRMLETKRRRRRCPSCGRTIEGRTCDRHG